MKKPDSKNKKPMANQIEFPEGYEVPKLDADDEFEFVARARKYPDGRFCIVATDGIPIDDKDDGDQAGEDDSGTDESLGDGAKAAMADGGSYG